MSVPKDKVTQTDKIADFIIAKLDGGYVCKSPEESQKLINLTLEYVDKGHNYAGTVKVILRKILKKRGVSLPDKGISILKGIKTKIAPPPTPTQPMPTQPTDWLGRPKSPLGQAPMPGVPSPPIQPGSLPSQPIPTPQPTAPGQVPPAIPMLRPVVPFSEEKKKEYRALFERGLMFLGKIYKKAGLIKTKEIEEPEMMDQEEFDKDVKELADAWAEYCITHNIELPTWIELFMLSAWSMFIFGGPLVTLMISGRGKKKVKQDKSLDDIEDKDEKKENEK